MKQIFLSIGLAVSAVFAYANPVNVQTARTVAENFIGSKDGGQTVTLQLTQSYASTAASGQTAMYIFDVNDGKGFVIVSGDDAVMPVLAYSTENIFPAQVTNKEVLYWLDGYNKQISYVITNQLTANSKVTAAWGNLLNNQSQSNHTAAKPTNVSPMLSTNWDQMNPSWSGTLLYNNLCPAGTPTGCVATAMAQIMNYWQYPASGTGSHTYNNSTEGGTLSANFNTTYDWDNMPAQLHTNSTPAQKNAVALLMYHCGVSVEMDYDLAENGGSGAIVINYGDPTLPCSQNALKNYFGYDNEIKGLRRSNYNSTTWISKLTEELDEGRPILYTGFGDLGGHAFVFDGYEEDNPETYFHINWGWSGNSNGYFVINDLSPSALGVGGGGGNFNSDQEALTKIKPAAIAPNLALNTQMTASQINIDPGAGFTVSTNIKNTGTGDLTNGSLTCGVYVGTTLVGYMQILSDQNLLSGSAMPVTFSTSGIAEMVPGTYTIKALYKANASDANWKPVSNGTSTNSITINVNSSSGIAQVVDNEHILIFPNPATGTVTLDWSSFSGKVTGAQLVNMLGQQVYQSNTLNGTTVKIPVAGVSAGNYFMKITTDKGAFSKKIVIQ